MVALMGATGAAMGAGPVRDAHATRPVASAAWTDAFQVNDANIAPTAGQEIVPTRHTHPPIDQIPPMPIPLVLEIPPQTGPAIDTGAPVMYDAQTGVETILPTRPSSRLDGERMAGFNGADLAQSMADYAPRGFGSMSEIGTPGSFPWRMNCKLVMRFVDSGGNNRYYVASGTMADPETVLTAGHCVYAHSPNGVVIEDWAEEIWVYPGWDGAGSLPDSFADNWGEARGTSFGSWTGWTVNESFDWDMGLVRVTRAVGMLTGWFGWQWTTNCPTSFYNNASYPSESCGSGLHNGRDMYYWSGTWDSCPGNQLQLNTGGGCFDTVWGGMSGSGAYQIDGDSRYVLGVCSNSNRNDVGRYCKMWEAWKNYMEDFKDGSRGSTFDLQALNARYSTSVITAGNSITGEFDAPNPTNADPGSNTYYFRHYLSTNDFISTGDTNVGGQWNYSANYGPVQNLHINPHSFTIPLSTPSGNYYLGVLLDPATDAFDSNDNTETWDSFPITVNGVADLVAQSVSAPSGVYQPGQNINVNFSTHNQGGDPSNSITVDFRLSLNNIISTGDVPLGTQVYSGLSGNGTLSTSSLRTIPGSIAPGTYYVGIIVSASDDVNSANNTVASIGTITVQNCPADLAAPFGTLDFSDVFAFLVAFGNHNPAADFAAPIGTFDYSDVFAFLVSFGNGCP
ncbi:MAG: GC-type dockerin domain-anchored protein [Phycisphaerales bacterium]